MRVRPYPHPTGPQEPLRRLTPRKYLRNPLMVRRIQICLAGQTRQNPIIDIARIASHRRIILRRIQRNIEARRRSLPGSDLLLHIAEAIINERLAPLLGPNRTDR